MSSIETTQERPARELVDGNRIPLLGLGVWQVPNGPDCVQAVRWALDSGYRHIDTAQAYGNEQSVGRALRESGAPREQVFITTKFYPNRRDPVAEIEASLRLLDTDYVDLYIVHWPQGGPTWAWAGMERAWGLGYARSVGVSNFDAHEIDEVVAAAQVPPAVNQVQLSPSASRRALLEQCRTFGIVPEAYSPLGIGQYLGDQTVNRIGVRIGRTPAQVLLRRSVQREIPVLAKSTRRDRIEANARIFDFTLSDADVAALDSLDRTGGTDQAREGKWW